MKSGLKWGIIALGGTVALLILILLILPIFVDADKFKPILEKKVTEMTGRSFSIGGKVDVSFFPFAGLSFSDLHLGNPKGFSEKDFITVKSFDVRVKLLPLLSRDIQVKHFILEDPRIVLLKNKQGHVNWDFSAPNEPKRSGESSPAPSDSGLEKGLPIHSLVVGDFSIKNGSLTWIDNAAGSRNSIEQIEMVLTDLSFDRPIGVRLSARVDDKPVSLGGTLGPIGQDPGKATIPLDMNLNALSELAVSLKGTVASPAVNPRADLTIDVPDFSPRRLMSAWGAKPAIDTSDPGVLNKVSLKAGITAASDRINVSKGSMNIDDSKLTFTTRISQFSKPEIALQAEIDRINIDRYLPSAEKPAAEPSQAPPVAKPSTGAATAKKSDYEALRRLILDANLKAGEVIVQKTKLTNLNVNITGKDGILRISPLQAELYQGHLDLNADVNVSQKIPRSAVNLRLKDIQAGPLLRDQTQKDILAGVTNGSVDIAFRGDDPELIRKTLGGGGELRFNNGAIKGVDLAVMIRSALAMIRGEAQAMEVGSRTEFTEMTIPFTISDGIFNTTQTQMQSPFLRVKAAGNANLISELLDFRLEATVIDTIKRQGDDQKGVKVPILVSGSFAEPKFAPDTSAIAQEQIEKQVFENKKVQEFIEKKGLKSYEEPAKNLLKKFLN